MSYTKLFARGIFANLVTDCSQSELFVAAKKFEIIAKRGVCWGLVGLWAFYKHQDREQECFFAIIRLIIFYALELEKLQKLLPGLDNEAYQQQAAQELTNILREPKEIAEQFMKKVLVQQTAHTYGGRQTFVNLGWQTYAPIILPNYTNTLTLLATCLDQLLTEDNLITISLRKKNDDETSRGHAVGVIKRKNKYYIYDPNCAAGEICCDDLNTVVANIIEAQKLVFGSVVNIDAHLKIHDSQPKPPLLKLIEKLIQIAPLKSHHSQLQQAYRVLVENQEALINTYSFIQPIIKIALAPKIIPSARFAAHLDEIKQLDEQIKEALAPYLKALEIISSSPTSEEILPPAPRMTR